MKVLYRSASYFLTFNFFDFTIFIQLLFGCVLRDPFLAMFVFVYICV